MKILAVGSCENATEIIKQVKKQTTKPNNYIFYEDPTPSKGLDNRRKRISENHQKLIQIVKDYKPDLVWQLEADSIIPYNCLERLLDQYKTLKSPKFGYISGIQIGRHGLYHIGAWRNIKKDSFESIDHKLKGLQKVQATGFYCLLAPTKVWLKGKAWWDNQPYGCDVNWGLSLKEYNIYVDMDLHIGHRTRRGEIWPEHVSTTTVKYKLENDKWKYRIYN